MSTEHHTDDREPLAYAYEGDELVAIVYKEKALLDFEERGHWLDVVRTPRGERLKERSDTERQPESTPDYCDNPECEGEP